MKKKKVMAISKEGNETLNIKLNGKDLEQVNSFTYVGGEITSDGRVTEDIKRRIAKGLQTMGAMSQIWRAKEIQTSTKVLVYKTVIVPAMLYGAETWALKKEDENRLLVAEMCCLRKILGVSRIQRIRNEEIRKRLDIRESIMDKIVEKRLRWYGHVVRMQQQRWPQLAMYQPVTGIRSKGRQRIRWIDNIAADLAEKMTITEANRAARDADKWRNFTTSYCHHWTCRQR